MSASNRRLPHANPLVLNVDADPFNADAPKRTWNLPAYRGPEFMRFMHDSGTTLDKFKTLPVYRHAVANGLIDPVTDEWQGPQADVTGGV